MSPGACGWKMKRGWWCSREYLHTGPCALRPKWWNIRWVLDDLWYQLKGWARR